MRQLIRADTITECQDKVLRMKQRGWTQLTDIKLDDSQMAYSQFDYVCVMELKEKEGHSGKKGWNRGGSF